MGVLEETQKAGTPAHHGCWPCPSLPLLASCGACPPCRKVGQTNCSKARPGRPITAIPEGLQWTLQHRHSAASPRHTLLAGLLPAPQLRPDLGWMTPAARRLRLPPGGWPPQVVNQVTCARGASTVHCFICSLRAQQRPLCHTSLEILSPILLEDSQQNHPLSEAFLSLLISEPAAHFPCISTAYAFFLPWNHPLCPFLIALGTQ